MCAQNIAYSGAMLASRYAILQQLGSHADAEALLDDAHAHWDRQAGGAKRDSALGWCLQALVGLKLKLDKVGVLRACS